MFLQRALISFTLGPLLLYLIYLGGWFYFLPVTIVLIFAALEYAQILQKLNWQLSIPLLLPLVFAQFVAAQWPQTLNPDLTLAVSLFVVMAYGLWLYEFDKSQTATADFLAMLGGVVLVGWVSAHFFRVRNLAEFPVQWTMLGMLSVWITDSAAYVVGKFLAGKVLGRHPMSPRLSPNKTVEGYLGGVVLGTLLTVLLGSYMSLPITAVLLFGLLISLIISPVGDLGISLIKRQAGVKDSGNLFPGHGGALDRIDSLMWGVAAAYYVGLLFQ